MLKKVFNFYKEGFANMKEGKVLWAIIALKLFIMFAVLKLFFFPNYLNTNFSSDEEKSEHVIERITNQKQL